VANTANRKIFVSNVMSSNSETLSIIVIQAECFHLALEDFNGGVWS
jgi:hypothetical protein